MKLIADATGIIALCEQSGHPDLLRSLNATYGGVLVPASVEREVGAKSQGLLGKLVASGAVVITHTTSPEDLARFRARHRGRGPGESDVMLTWQSLQNMGIDAKCILDDRRARNTAKRLGIKFTGVVGLLEELKMRGFLNSVEHCKITDKLRASDFRIP